MTGNGVIRIAKTLAIFMEQIAKQTDVDLDDTEITIKLEGNTLMMINAGAIVASATALQYGCIDDIEE